MYKTVTHRRRSLGLGQGFRVTGSLGEQFSIACDVYIQAYKPTVFPSVKRTQKEAYQIMDPLDFRWISAL